MNIQTLLESSSPYKQVRDDASRLAKKWADSGLLEGLKTEVERHNMSMLLENQAKQIITEANVTGAGVAGASFTAGAGEQWAGVALPLVRRIFAEIAAKDFVSVQPMNLPSGLVFYLDFKYGTTKSPFTSGDSLYGATANLKDTDLTKGLYGAGRFSYSINNATGSGTGTVTSASWADVNFDANFSSSVLNQQIKLVAVPTASIPDFDPVGVRAFIPASGSTALVYLQSFTKLSGGNIVFALSGSTGQTPNGGTYTITYQFQPRDNARGDFEDGNSVLNAQNQPIVIPTVDVQLRSDSIVAKTRKLKAQWTPEFSQDLNAYHSLDAEAELTSMLSEYIAMEVDLEILSMLIENASTVDAWSAVNNQQTNADLSGFTQQSATTGGFYNSQGQWFQTLGTKLAKVSNKIHQKTLRGGANFLVTSPTVCTILESIPGYATDAKGGEAEFAMGVQKAGTINSRWKVYKNPYMTENLILMGFRGSQFLETGAVYAPYVPLIMTPIVYDPDTFTPRKGLLTRYAKKMVRPDFYGVVKVAGLDTI